MQKRYGTHPDIPDHRDHYFKPSKKLKIPEAVDLRPHCPPVYNQHKLNSCSANALAGVVWYEMLRNDPQATSPSRLFIYYNERARERKVSGNVPVSLRDGYKTLSTQGVCPEEMWPYVYARFTDKPRAHCYHVAKSQRVSAYARIHRSVESMRAVLASGHPFTVGISVHESFEENRMKHTGRGYLPKRGERLLGGHAVAVVGYHDESQRFLLRNSWGKKWGLEGYFTLPYDYLLHEALAWDFWMMEVECSLEVS